MYMKYADYWVWSTTLDSLHQTWLKQQNISEIFWKKKLLGRGMNHKKKPLKPWNSNWVLRQCWYIIVPGSKPKYQQMFHRSELEVSCFKKKEKTVFYASRSLSSTEQRYAQMEKEALALTWAYEQFADFLVGVSSFTIETDHKPLLTLMKTKHVDELNPCIQRFRMRMMRFS